MLPDISWLEIKPYVGELPKTQSDLGTAAVNSEQVAVNSTQSSEEQDLNTENRKLNTGEAIVVTDVEVEAYQNKIDHRQELCVVIPAYNEELVLAASLKSLVHAIDPKDIYVVSDGSSDETVWVARQFTDNVLDLKDNGGKARALEQLIATYQLTDRYQYVMFNDADSRLVPNFLDVARKYMTDSSTSLDSARDKSLGASQPACIVGTVGSIPKGLISAYRVYEYGLSHRVFKSAQNSTNVITVAPGCASLYHSDALRALDFSHNTLTEDFDLTLQIHNKGLGKVVYAPGLKVYTQDPLSLQDYWKQVSRWYTGFWQNVFLHKIYQPNHPVNLEIWLVVSDTIGWGFYAALAFYNLHIFWSLTVFSYVMFSALAFIILVLERQLWALRYLFFFPMFQVINLVCYLFSFFRAIRTGDSRLNWHKVSRYA